MDIQKPSDWGISHKDSWVSFEELKDNGAPALEGRDVVSFAAGQFVPDNIKQMAAGKPNYTFTSPQTRKTYTKTNGHWTVNDVGGQQQQSTSPAQRMEQARRSGKWKGPTVDESTSKSQSRPPSQPQKTQEPKAETPVAEKPPRETETQREATERAKKEIKSNTSVESYRQSEIFNVTTIHNNETFLKSPPHDIIQGKQFVDIKKELEATGLFSEGVNFPPKYLDLLSQLGVTKAKGVDGPPLSDYIQGAGAGAPMSQVGELMMMTSSSMSDEQADAYFEILNRIGDNSSVVNKDWVTAAKRNRYALQRAITNNLGGGQVVAASWDVKREVEELGLNYEDKGFSTDAFFRVKTNDGSEIIFEVSLKKDKSVFFINGGAGTLALESIKAMPSESPIRRQYEEIESSLQELKDKYNKGANFTAQYPKILKKMTDEEKKEIEGARKRYEELDKKKRNFLKENTSQYNSDVYMDNLVKNVYQPAAKEFLQNKDALNELERVAKEGGVNLQKYVKALKAGSLEEALQKIAEAEPDNSTENHKKLLAKVFEATTKVGSENEVLNKYTQGLADGYKKYHEGLSSELAKDGPLRTAVISNIRKEFPLKAVLNGEEVMCIGDVNFDLKTAERVFGTTDIEEVNQKLTIKKDKSGSPILVYSAGEEGEEIPVATIRARQRGIGYASMGFEAGLHPEFYDKVQQAVVQENLNGQKRVRYTKAEAKKGPRDPQKHIPEGGSFVEEEKAGFTEADYLEMLKLSRNSEFADSMVYYKGKVLGRCPKGTIKTGKTCVPGTDAQKFTKYKPGDLGGVSNKQIKKLSKAKTIDDIIKAHKEENEQND